MSKLVGFAAIRISTRSGRAAEAHLQGILVSHLHGDSRHPATAGPVCRLDDVYTRTHGHASTHGEVSKLDRVAFAAHLEDEAASSLQGLASDFSA